MKNCVLRVLLMLLTLFSYTASAVVPSKPVLQFPANQQAGFDNSYFSWKVSVDDQGDTLAYDFYLGTTPNNLVVYQDNIYNGFFPLENPDIFAYADGDDFYFIRPPLDAGKTYYWKVVAKNSSGAVESDTWSFSTNTVNDYSPTKPVNPLPALGAIDVANQPLLQWSESTDNDGDSVTYKLYVDTANPPIKLVATDVTTTSFKIQDQLKGNTRYYWKIVADDGRGRQTVSDTWNFTIINTPPSGASLLLPADNALNIPYTTTLSWQKAFDADNDIAHYELWYGPAEPLVSRIETIDTQLSLNLVANTTYYWKVVVVDSHGGRTVSDTWTFKTISNTINHAPTAPLLQAPVNNATGIGWQQSLQWSASIDADQDAVLYDVYLGTNGDSLKRIALGLNVLQFLPAGLKIATAYYWKVVAYDLHGGIGESTIQHFTTTADDPGLTNLVVYYRYPASTIYQFVSSPLTPAFSVDSTSYRTIGRTTMNDGVALALYYNNPNTIVSFDLPSSFTYMKDITHNNGLPTTSTADIYQIEGDFLSNQHTSITVHLRVGTTERIYTIDVGINQLPSKPVLIMPADGAENVSIHPTFYWEGGDDPDAGTMIYRIFWGTSPSELFSSALVQNKKTFTPSATFMSRSRYYWKVIAQDMLTQTTESDVHSFTTEKAVVAPPTSPVLMYPRAISTYMETTFDLVWRYDPGKNAIYDVYLGVQSDPQRIATGISDVKYPVKDLSYNTTYYWKIIAYHADGTTTVSPVQKFKTKPQNGNQTGSFTDARDGQIYQWVKIDNQYWMVHNLAYEPDAVDGFSGYQYSIDVSTGGKEYFMLDDRKENLDKYGYLYNWAGAMNAAANTNPEFEKQGVCPTDWHIPVYKEWEAVSPTLSGTAGTAANTVYYDTWSISGHETEWLNQSGLSVLPAGYRTGSNVLVNANAMQFWLADDYGNIRYLYDDFEKRLRIYYRTESAYLGGSSVRCVKNVNEPPTVPVLASPSDQTQNIDFNSITLNWSASTDADGDAIKYQVYLDKEPAPVRIVAKDMTANSYQANDLEQNTVWYWKVKAIDSYGHSVESPVWSFTTRSATGNTAPGIPQLLQPAHEATAVSLTPSLNWSAVTDADSDTPVYDVYVGESVTDLTRVAENIVVTNYTLTTLSSSTTFFWQVIAKDGKGGNTASLISRFTTLNNPPQKPVLTAPANNVQGLQTGQRLSWKEAADPDGDPVTYKLYTGTSPSALQLYASPTANYLDINFSLNTVYYWQVVADDGKGATTASDVWNFKTAASAMSNATTLKAPLNGATGVSLNPKLEWNAYPSTSFKYDLYVGTTAAVTLVAYDLASTTTSYTINAWDGNTKLAPHTTYLWKIVLKNSQTSISTSETDSWSFTTINQIPSKPGLVSPANNAANQPYTVTLEWQASTDADNDRVLYDVYLATSASPQQLVAVNLQQLTCDVPSLMLKPNTQYYWKVVAKDQYGGSVASDVRSFTTVNGQNPAPGAPVLTTPASYVSGVQTPVMLQWNASVDIDDDAVVYDVYAGTNSNALTTAVATGLTVTNYTITTGLQSHTVYYWKVVARDTRNGTATSTIWNFMTINNPPSAVTLASPVNGAKLTADAATLNWTAATDPDGDAIVYDIYLDKTTHPTTLLARNQSGLSFITATLESNTTYYWRVVAKDPYTGETSSEVQSFISRNHEPSAPVLQSPGNLAAVSTSSTTLTWQVSTDVDGDALSYEVYLDTDPVPVNKLGTLYNGHAFTTPVLTENVTYYWKVVAKDTQGGSAGSSVWSFKYQTEAANLAPSVPILQTPANSITILGKQVTLTWTSSSDPEGDVIVYDVYTSNNAGVSTRVASDLTTTTYTLYDLAAGMYYWKVVAKDQINNSPSTVWQFTVQINYDISGHVSDDEGIPLRGVLLQGFPVVVYTDEFGDYTAEVPGGWSGTVTPVLTDYTFDPTSKTYANVVDTLRNEHYLGTPVVNNLGYIISGYIRDASNNPKAGVVLQGFATAVETDTQGEYTVTVPAGWSGNVTPVFDGLSFVPPSRNYSNVVNDHEDESYTASVVNGLPDADEQTLAIHPNPTGGTTRITLSRPLRGTGVLILTNNYGQEVARYEVDSGTIEVPWNGTDRSGNAVSAGIYYCRLFTGTQLVAYGRIAVIN